MNYSRLAFCFLIALISSAISSTAHASDFSGSWSGKCVNERGAKYTTREEIKHLPGQSIEINGFTYSLQDPTYAEEESRGEDGYDWKSVTIYRWVWDEAEQAIQTNADWTAWYLNRPGKVTGAGRGFLRIAAHDTLEWTYSSKEEFDGHPNKDSTDCVYTRE